MSKPTEETPETPITPEAPAAPEPTKDKIFSAEMHEALSYVLSKENSTISSALNWLSNSNSKVGWGRRMFTPSFLPVLGRVLLFAIRHPMHTLNLASGIRKIVKEEQYKLDDFPKVLLQKPEVFEFAKTLADKVPQIAKILDGFGVKILNDTEHGGSLKSTDIGSLQALLRQGPALQESALKIYDQVAGPIRNHDFPTTYIQKIVGGIAANPAAKGLIAENPSFAPHLAAAIVTSIPHVDARLKELKLDTEIFNIAQHIDVGHISKIFEEVNKLREGKADASVMTVVDTVLTALNDPDKGAALKTALGDQATRGVFTNLVVGILDAKGQRSPELAKFGVTPEHLKGLAAILPLVLDKSEDLQKVLDNVIKPNLPQLLESYAKKDLSFVKDLCDMVEKNPSLHNYLQDHKEAFGKIIDIVVDNVPIAKSWASYLNIETTGKGLTKYLVETIIDNPGVVKTAAETYERYQKDGVAGIAKVAGNKAVEVAKEAVAHPIEAAQVAAKGVVAGAAMAATGARAAAGMVYNAAYNWIKGERQQDFAQTVVDKLSELPRVPGQKSSVVDFLRTEVESINPENAALKAKFQDLVDRKDLFTGVTIQQADQTVNLSNLDFKGVRFVGTTFSNVSFAGSDLREATFEDSTFTNVDFKGAIINGPTLSGMIPGIKKGDISLEGVTIVGDISGLNLSDINLQGADLSGVTQMNNTNFRGANLKDAKLPESAKLVEAFNLDIPHRGVVQAQQYRLIEKVVDKIVETGPSLTTPQQNNLRSTLFQIYNSDSEVGHYVKSTLEATPQDLVDGKFSLPNSNTSDYQGKTADILNVLHENREHPEKIKSAIASNIIADKITEELFANGDHRGQDGLLIRAEVKKYFDHSGLNPEALLQDKQIKGTLAKIAGTLHEYSQYTVVGMAYTSGIQLPKDPAVAAALVDNAVKFEMNQAFGQSALNKDELAAIDAMATKMSANLDTPHDKALVNLMLKNTFYEVKSKSSQLDISTTINLAAKHTSPIELGESTTLEALSDTLNKKTEEALALNEAISPGERGAIHKIASEIAKNLLGKTDTDGAVTTLIREKLKVVLVDIKREYGGKDLSEQLEEHKEQIVGQEGNMDWKRKRVNTTGLTELFYNEGTSYTGVGLLSGSVLIDENKVRNIDTKALKEMIVNELQRTEKQHQKGQPPQISEADGKAAKHIVSTLTTSIKPQSAPKKPTPQKAHQNGRGNS